MIKFKLMIIIGNAEKSINNKNANNDDNLVKKNYYIIIISSRICIHVAVSVIAQLPLLELQLMIMITQLVMKIER